MTSTLTAPATGRDRTQFRLIRLADIADMEFRVDGGKREFDGIAVPWDVEIDVDGWAFESWQRGAFNHQLRAANRIKVGYGHIPLGGDLIGRLRSMSDDAKGLRITGKVSPGVPRGDEAMALMEDKALDELSIGFWDVPGGTTMTRDAQQRPHYRMTKGDLFEVALVPFGAYGRKATVDTLREQRGPGERERIEVKTRQLTVMMDGQTGAIPFDGTLSDALRTLMGGTPPTPVGAPAEPVTPPEPAGPDLSGDFAFLDELPSFEVTEPAAS